MKHRHQIVRRAVAGVLTGTLLPVAGSAGAAPVESAAPVAAAARTKIVAAEPRVIDAAAHDESAPLRDLAASYEATSTAPRLVPERGPLPVDRRFGGDAAVQTQAGTTPMSAPLANFEGLSNQDNLDVYGFQVSPPDPVGDVGPDHYVEMINLLVGAYDKTGTPLIAPTPLGALWAGFAVQDCTDASGDPIVVYDQLADRWILTQFTTRGLDDPTLPFYNCVAISTNGDPTGSYYRYAFSTGFNFPDYPKYGVWTDSYVVTTREFGPTVEYGIGVYALEKDKMLDGEPASALGFFLDGNDPDILKRIGDGLLPADLDGTAQPPPDAAISLMGSQDDDFPNYNVKKDALNIWDLKAEWEPTPEASLIFSKRLLVKQFDSNFPCGNTGSRNCLPQPGVEKKDNYLDVLSYRQRPTWRLAYRNFGTHESLVTNQSVEASKRVAGVRWYEVRRNENGRYSLYQQGTYAPDDGVNRWMGSIAQDAMGNMALGYSVVDGDTVYPGIRYTGRRVTDPLGEMTFSEGIIINGSGVQKNSFSRWGDYTSMNIDPDDCTFWYVNEYYTEEGEEASPTGVGWQTRIASFQLPGSGC